MGMEAIVETKPVEEDKPRIGVFVCHCGVNIAAVIDPKKLAEYAATLPNVVVAKDYTYMCSKPGQQLIIDSIKQYNLNRVVIAACSPRLHEPTFRKCLASAGLNPYLLEMANIREHCTWVHTHEPDVAFEKAKKIVELAVTRANLLEPLEEQEVSVIQRIMVIGGGIAGLFAALAAANAGFEVYLVELSPTIGGRMAQLDKTFPTLDCSKCVLTPIMNEAAAHPNIKLFTYTEVVDVQGSIGNFKVKLRKKPRYVDPSKCTACGICAEKCPVKVPNEFDMGLSMRKAIYLPFPQAVPTVYLIDPEHCLYLTKRDPKTGKPICGVCQRFCPAGAINFDEKPEEIEVDVGAIIIATGFDVFDPREKPEYGYGKYPNVITSLEFERILCATGPTGGKILCPPDWKKEPKRIVFIHCIGSRDETVNAPFCSRVCCMYTAKQAILYKERVPDGEAYVFYIDVRAAGKGFEEFYRRAVEEYGITYIRGKVSEIIKDPVRDTLVVRAEDTLTGKIVEVEADLVVLAVGMRPRKSTLELAKILKLPLSADGFLQELHMKLYPVQTAVDGVYICGCAQSPKDIPDSIAQAVAAAGYAMSLLSQGKVRTIGNVAEVNEDLCSGCGICEATCAFGAISLETKVVEGREVRRAKVDVLRCKGCGACAAACPAGAIKAKHFTDDQLLSMIRALFVGPSEALKAIKVAASPIKAS